MKIKQIWAGHARSMAVLDDNSAWAWGNIARAEALLPPDDPLSAICGASPTQVGHGRYAQPVPQRLNPQAPLVFLCDAVDRLLGLDPTGGVCGLAPVASVTAGAAAAPIRGLVDGLRFVCSNETASYALDRGGRVWSWGHNFQGQLGRVSASPLNQPPAPLPELPPMAKLAAGMNHTLALSGSGEVWAWGANAAGQLGLGHLSAVTQPQRVPLSARVVAVAAGQSHSLAIDEHGRVHAWGSNHCGQLGPVMGKEVPAWASRPTRVRLPFRVRDLGAGAHYTAALTDQGEVRVWGWNGFGQLGESVGVSQSTSKPHAVAGLGRVERISVGAFHVMAVEPRGLCAWGDNRHAACGLGASEAVVIRPNVIALA